MEYVLVSKWEDGNKFWSGIYWSSEYPDAFLYKDLEEAKRRADKFILSVVVDVIKDYGFDSEEVVHCNLNSFAPPKQSRNRTDEQKELDEHIKYETRDIEAILKLKR